MKKVDFNSTKGIMKEIESIVDDEKCDSEELKKSDMRLRGCKHAIQIIATALKYNEYKGLKSNKLKPVELE